MRHHHHFSDEDVFYHDDPCLYAIPACYDKHPSTYSGVPTNPSPAKEVVDAFEAVDTAIAAIGDSE